jgi:hypothetical protein
MPVRVKNKSTTGAIIGVAAAVVAVVFLLFASSDTVKLGTFTVFDKSGIMSGKGGVQSDSGGTHVSVGGITVGTGSNTPRKRIGPIPLSAEYNPIKITMRLHYFQKSSLQRPSATVRILDDDRKELWSNESRWRTSHSKNKKKKNRHVHRSLYLGSFTIPASGQYYFDCNVKADGARFDKALLELTGHQPEETGTQS